MYRREKFQSNREVNLAPLGKPLHNLKKKMYERERESVCVCVCVYGWGERFGQMRTLLNLFPSNPSLGHLVIGIDHIIWGQGRGCRKKKKTAKLHIINLFLIADSSRQP